MYARLLPISLLSVLMGCKGCHNKDTNDTEPIGETGDTETGETGVDDTGPVDADHDGYTSDVDCDDDDASVGAGSTWYQDADHDGYGDPDAETVVACDQPEGYAATGDDCNDADPAYHPNAEELDCEDPNDYNCDGSVGYADVDGDGVSACQDCDDSNITAYPGADELCDGVDNDCDTEIDEDATDAGTWYTDADGDGYGVDGTDVTSCDRPDGTAEYGGDCNDDDTAWHPGAAEDDCTDPNDYNCDGSVGYDDLDGDGYAACEECDDADADDNPGATEVCDGDDDDCDGEIDEDDAYDAGTWYTDSDGDTFGDPTTGTVACDAPTGTVADNTDCDDTHGEVYPGHAEICDDLDNDCNGEVDDGASDSSVWYADADGDGYGDAGTGITACDPGDTYSLDDTDCDDGDGTIYPGADEYCNGYDDDCDGEIDESDALDASTWYSDGDSDGYGVDDATTTACDAPDGYAEYGGDCDDSDPAYNPGATEDDCADPNDYNCDGTVGYDDSDGDGWAACEECDDGDSAVNPGATEICDDIDNDCDGTVDETDASDASSWYADSDGDGYGDAGTAVSACSAPEGYVADATDCDDSDGDVHPDGAEYCDGIDNDCDGAVDEDSAFDASTWYADTDDDGYGDAGSTVDACSAPTGYVADDNDCDDTDADVNPDGTEVCNDLDDDCDGSVDEDATDAKTWYADYDIDTYGDPDDSVKACSRPAKHRQRAGDCDDTNAAINPAATEVCDGVDNDCDGEIDESGASGETTWYTDGDGDGFGDPDTASDACDAPTGGVADGSDCDDGDADINPDATEVCDGVDNDCDGAVDEAGATGESTWYADSDRDGFGDPDASEDACDKPSGYVADDTDCDDGDGGINPDATEVCDGVDNDCDGSIDEDSAADAGTWYTDADHDTYGDPDSATTACSAPTGTVADDSDCDDSDAAVNPAATEVCDGIDNDCDGHIDENSASDASTWYTDSDDDGYGDADSSTKGCTAPTGTVADDTDCDDTRADVNPGEDEVCDDTDNDCDGEIDEDAVDAVSWYTDSDDDGYGDDSTEVLACDAPTGTVSDGGDCDDGDDTINPGEVDDCNGIDNDCDGTIDEAAIEGKFLMSADTSLGYVLSIDPDTVSATEVATLDKSVNIPSVALGPDGTGYIHTSGTLYTFDPCTDTKTSIGASGRGTVCGLSFDGDGNLWGLDRNSRTLVKFDTATGAGTSIGPLGFKIAACGMAYDCTNDRIVAADATSNSLFTIDLSTGAATDFVSTGLTLTSVGLEYDPTTQSFLLSTGTDLYDVDYDSGDVEYLGAVSSASNVDDLIYFPECPLD